MKKKLGLIISFLFVFGQMALFAQSTAENFKDVSVSIKYFDRTVYYPGSEDENPVFVQVSIRNNGAKTLRFKLADDRMFSVDFHA